MVGLFGVLTGMALTYTQVITGSAAILHIDAFTATIMAATVAMHINLHQKVVVADLKAGRVPDAKYGRIAKQRSLHNNSLTLPVIFFMLVIHYPLAFATPWNWLIASLIFLEGAIIRHWFNTRHARKGNPHWTWAAAVIIFILIAWLSTGPKLPTGAEAVAAPSSVALMQSPHFPDVSQIVQARCPMCHTAEPVWPGVAEAPKNVILDNDIAIANHAREIAIQAGYSRAMPPGNLTEMTEEERALIVAWYREGPQ